MTAQTTLARVAYSPDEFAAITGLGRTTVFALVREGALRSVKVGRRRLIAADEVSRFLAQN